MIQAILIHQTSHSVYSEENGPKVWDVVKACAHDLFEEYWNKYAPPNATTPTDDPQEPKQTQEGRMKSLIAKKTEATCWCWKWQQHA